MELDENMWARIGEYNREHEDPETALPRANMHKANNNFKQAILDYNHYLKYKPEEALPYLHLADCYFFLDNYQEAIVNYENGIARITGEIPYDFFNNYGGALLDSGEYEKALTIADKVVNQNKNSVSYLLKGQVLLQLDKYDVAFYYLTRAIEIDPKRWEPWATRAKLDYCLGDYYRVILDFKNAHLLNANLPAHYYTTHAFALNNIGKNDEALKEFERAKILGDPEAKAICEKLILNKL